MEKQIKNLKPVQVPENQFKHIKYYLIDDLPHPITQALVGVHMEMLKKAGWKKDPDNFISFYEHNFKTQVNDDLLLYQLDWAVNYQGVTEELIQWAADTLHKIYGKAGGGIPGVTMRIYRNAISKTSSLLIHIYLDIQK